MSDSEDSLIDTNDYSIQDYFKLVTPLWESKYAESNYLNHHKLLRTILDFSLTHSLFLNNLQKREIRFGDIESSTYNGSIDTIIIQSKSNNNPFGFYGCFRNKYIEFCPHLALAAYFFVRFHVPDTYGTLELQFNENSKIELDEIKLLKGSNKLSSISYSQQHKSSISALGISGLNYRDINLSKLLATQDTDALNINEKKQFSTDKTTIPYANLFKLAGFESEKEFDIPRSKIEPPQELLDMIFPFLSLPESEFSNTPEFKKLKNVLLMLRRTLCQDMVILRKRYPNNCLSKHPIFNSDLFNNFTRETMMVGILEKEPIFKLKDTNGVTSPNRLKESSRSSSTGDSTSASSVEFQKLQTIIDAQSYRIDNIESRLSEYRKEHQFINDHLSEFISKQNEAFQAQSEFLQRIQHTTNANLVLLTSRNKNMIPLVQQNLQDSAELINTVGTANLNTGISNSMDLLGKLKDYNQQFTTMQNQTSVPPNEQSKMPLNHNNIVHHQSHYPPGSHHVYPYGGIRNSPHKSPYQTDPAIMHENRPVQQDHSMNPLPLQPNPAINYASSPASISSSSIPTVQETPQYNAKEIKRQAALNRRLSRQVSTLFEMWDDFKGLEKELKDHEITMTEWLKVHGSSERQFRHTRLKIIKFIEDEALRNSCDVEHIKQKLHIKMRNRLRPWTLDEVQRMLTSGKRINLDD